MRVILDVIQGPRRGRSFVFDRHDTFIVGRSRFVHCPLPEDTALSRDHFLIEIDPPRCELRDLGSTNGTYVNERRVSQVRLSSNDRILAGKSVFRVRVEGAEGTPVNEETPWPIGPAAAVARNPDGTPIVCAGCGTFAPVGIGIAQGSGVRNGEAVHWLCDACRIEAAATFQPVSHYTALRELGRGAMGVVYLAQHNVTGRKVALKAIVPESATTKSAIARFMVEMNIMSNLKHPNIVEWLEQGSSQGRFWFAMEYVAGESLEALAAKHPGRFPIYQACRMACQVLKGLEHAHGLGFVHRDIKPDNILIGRTDAGLVAKVSDFGLAKNFRAIGLSGLTFSGEMRGTIPFMPPEQMLDFKTVTPSGDLYATAATLYFLITGKFIYNEVTEGGDLIRTLLEEQPVPIRERRPEVPPALAEVMAKCLSREPAGRYPTATEMRQALRPFC